MGGVDLKVSTTRFGEVEVDDNRIVDFPLGVPGFAGAKRFFLVDHRENIWWLQAVDDADLAFIVTEPFSLFPEYSFKLTDDIESLLQIEDPQSIVVLAILSVDVSGAQVNLRAPIIINSMKLLGAQIVTDDESHSFKTPLPKPSV